MIRILLLCILTTTAYATQPAHTFKPVQSDVNGEQDPAFQAARKYVAHQKMAQWLAAYPKAFIPWLHNRCYVMLHSIKRQNLYQKYQEQLAARNYMPTPPVQLVRPLVLLANVAAKAQPIEQNNQLLPPPRARR